MKFLLDVVMAPSFPAWVQAAAAVGALTITGWLALITRRYVQITNDALTVSREQLASQQRVYAEFGLRNAGEGKLHVWVVNLGTANFLVSEIRVRAASRESSVQTLKLNSTVLAGRPGEWFPLPDHYWEDDSWRGTRYIDVSLSCVSSGEHKRTEWRPFTLVMDSNSDWRIHRGFSGPLPVTCPECLEYTGLKMKSDNLENLDAAWQRRNEVEKHLQSSHPHHKSRWLVGSP
jgi:hypothetical protein